MEPSLTDQVGPAARTRSERLEDVKIVVFAAAAVAGVALTFPLMIHGRTSGIDDSLKDDTRALVTATHGYVVAHPGADGYPVSVQNPAFAGGNAVPGVPSSATIPGEGTFAASPGNLLVETVRPHVGFCVRATNGNRPEVYFYDSTLGRLESGRRVPIPGGAC